MLPAVISPDQTGFMIGRQSFIIPEDFLIPSFLQVPTLPKLCYLSMLRRHSTGSSGSICFLNKFGFSLNFIAWIQLLYSSPVASVHTNATHSKTFRLYRGTHQGCPLSPLLFALAIEPLAIWLRSEEKFEGITRFGTSYKLSLYADDLLLYITNPISSLPPVLKIFN